MEMKLTVCDMETWMVQEEGVGSTLLFILQVLAYPTVWIAIGTTILMGSVSSASMATTRTASPEGGLVLVAIELVQPVGITPFLLQLLYEILHSLLGALATFFGSFLQLESNIWKVSLLLLSSWTTILLFWHSLLTKE